MKTSYLMACFLAAAGILIGIMSSSGRQPATAVVYVVDYSASNKDAQNSSLGMVLSELETIPAGTLIAVYRMGSSTEEIFNGELSDGTADEVLATLKRATMVSDPKHGTDFANMAVALAGFVHDYRGKGIRLRILTDGGDDFPHDPKHGGAYKAAAARICADMRVTSILFYGVKAGLREPIRRAFASANDRLQILDRDQMISN